MPLTAFAFLVAAPSLASAQHLPSLDRGTRHLDELYRSQSSHARMTMTVVRPRQTRELTLESWMGSHVTNDDLMRETSYDDDYQSVLAWVTRDGTRYLQVTLTPKPEAPVVYTRLVFLLTRDEWVPVRWEFYDGDKMVRTISYEDVRQVAGRRLPLRMVIQPAGAPDEPTVVGSRP